MPHFKAGMFVLVIVDSLHIDSMSDVDGLLKFFKKNLNFMAPFYGWGSVASRQG